jgi:hypothetical protein
MGISLKNNLAPNALLLSRTTRAPYPVVSFQVSALTETYSGPVGLVTWSMAAPTAARRIQPTYSLAATVRSPAASGCTAFGHSPPRKPPKPLPPPPPVAMGTSGPVAFPTAASRPLEVEVRAAAAEGGPAEAAVGEAAAGRGGGATWRGGSAMADDSSVRFSRSSTAGVPGSRAVDGGASAYSSAAAAVEAIL